VSEESALIPASKLDVAIIFSDEGLEEILTEIERQVKAHVPDVTTDHGRKDIASLAYKVARSKTVVDDFGKSVISDWKKKTDNINGY
jgi:transcription termination factor Rho